MRKRTYAAITTAVIAASMVALYATGATGAGPRVVSFKTIDTIKTFKAFTPTGDPSNPIQPTAGDTIVATADSVIGKTKVGGNVTHCQLVTDTKAQCQATWHFNGKKGTRRGGSITAAGELHFGSEEISRAPIVGGTGRVRGVRGEIVRTSVSPGKDQVVFKILDE